MQACPLTNVPGTHVPEHSPTCNRVYTHTARLQNRVRCVQAQPCQTRGSTPAPQRAHLRMANAPRTRLHMRARPPGAQARVGACLGQRLRECVCGERPSSRTASPPRDSQNVPRAPGLGSPVALLPQLAPRSVRGDEERGFQTFLILWLLALVVTVWPAAWSYAYELVLGVGRGGPCPHNTLNLGRAGQSG